MAEKRDKTRFTFTELSLKRLKVDKSGQYSVWDKPSEKRGIGQIGLSVLVSPKGTKRYRAYFQVHGKTSSVKLGRVGEMPLGTARKRTAELRGQASDGTDPREEARKARAEAEKRKTFEEVATLFIEQYAKPRQRTWAQTERVLMKTCAPWLKKSIESIQKEDAYELLEGIKAQGHHAKAAKTLVWLQTMWRWAYKRGHVSAPLMDQVDLHVEKKKRNPFRDLHSKEQRAKKIADDIKAMWAAANQLDKVDAAFVKLLILLVPRKGALAAMKWGHVEDGTWIVPAEQTKGFRLQNPDAAKPYIVPLPPLAARILKSLSKKDQKPDEWVFPGRGGVHVDPGSPFKSKLVEAGAPPTFMFHDARHYVATWLEDQGHSEFERALVLNHSSGAGVTAGYSHGLAFDLKRDLLQKWSDYVEQIVGKKGAVLLR